MHKSPEEAHITTEPQAVADGTTQKILDLTTEIFGDEVTVESSYDPEFPCEIYTVVSPKVSAGVNRATILRMESQWVERVARMPANGHGFRLRIRRST